MSVLLALLLLVLSAFAGEEVRRVGWPHALAEDEAGQDLPAAEPVPTSGQGLGTLDDPAVFARWQSWVENHPPPTDHPEPAYHFHDQIHAELAAWVERRPHAVRPFLAGRSAENRPIWGYVIKDPSRPVHTRALVFSCIHALEWISAEVSLALALEFAERPLPGVELVVIPVLNVDGRLKVESDLLEGESRYRRGNAWQVDLNRDFAVHHEAQSFWRHLLPGYHSSSAAPLSQPESRIIDALAAEGDFDFAASLHAFGGFVYLPWSGRWQRPDDWKDLHALGVAMSSGQGAHAYRVLQLSRWGFFFRAQGSELDHLYGEHGIPTVLMECTRSGLSLFRPREWRYYFRWYNPRNPARHLREGRRALAAGLRHSSRDDPS